MKINNIAVKNLIFAMDMVAEIPPGTKAVLTVLRKGDEINIDVIIGELSNSPQNAQRE
ncbi:MAG: serine protease DegS [Sphingobacteriales bacterium]